MNAAGQHMLPGTYLCEIDHLFRLTAGLLASHLHHIINSSHSIAQPAFPAYANPHAAPAAIPPRPTPDDGFIPVGNQPAAAPAPVRVKLSFILFYFFLSIILAQLASLSSS